MKKQIPLRKQRSNADFSLKLLIARNNGTRANHERNSRLNLGKERIRISEDRRAKAILSMTIRFSTGH